MLRSLERVVPELLVRSKRLHLHLAVAVHKSAVQRAGMRTLREGQKISFEIQDDPKSRKKSATNLKDAA